MTEENEQGETEQDSFRVNWRAVFAVVLGLVFIGMLLGKLSSAPDGLTVVCPTFQQVTVVQVGDHVEAYCNLG